MRLETDNDLLVLCKSQYQEAEANVKPRLPEYAWAVDAWRGKFRDGASYYAGVDFSWFGMKNAFVNTQRVNIDGIPDIYVRLAFQTVENIAARFDKFFVSQNKPFEIVPPRTIWGAMPPDPAREPMRAGCLKAATNHLIYDYHYHKNPERLMVAVKQCLTLGTGFVLNLQAESPDPYPHAILQALNAWDVLEDPLALFPEDWRYCWVRQWSTIEAAKKRYPNCIAEIDEAQKSKDRGGQTTSNGTGGQRDEILLLHTYGVYDLSSLEAAKPDEGKAKQDGGSPKLCRLTWIGTTGSSSSGPTPSLLKWYELDPDIKTIPIEAFSIIKDPCETSVRGVGLPLVVKDDSETLNALREALLLNLEFLSNPGGFYNAGMQDIADQALGGEIRPREWRGLQMMPGQNINDVLQERAVRPLLDQITAISADLRMEPGRKTGVGGSAEGTIESNTTGTATQDQNLRDEANELFRYRGQRLDSSLKRMYRNHVLYSAKAIKGESALSKADSMVEYLQGQQSGQVPAEVAPPEGKRIFYVDEDGSYQPLDISFFDEPWEVELRSGTTSVDGVAQAQILSGIMGQAAAFPEVIGHYDGVKVVDFALQANQIAPEQFKKSQQQLQQEAQAQQQAASQPVPPEPPKITVAFKGENLPTDAQGELLGAEVAGAVNPETGPGGVPGGPPPPSRPPSRPPSGSGTSSKGGK